MKYIVKDLDEFNYYLKETDDGGIWDSSLDNETIILFFDVSGGAFEDIQLFIKFNHIQIFHLGLSMRDTFIGVQIDEIKKISLSKLTDIMPYKIEQNVDTQCYRFYAQDNPTCYYIICESLDLWINNYDCLNDYYKLIS